MFEQIYQKPLALQRHQCSPLVNQRWQFLKHLAQRGLSTHQLQSIAVEFG